jgi:hypothetical protein
VVTIFSAEGMESLTDTNLSEVAPSECEDDTSISLSEIAGYKIYYGSIQGQYPNRVNVNDSSAAGYAFKAFLQAPTSLW